MPSILSGLAQIPPSDLLVILALVMLLFALVWMRLRKTRSAPGKAQSDQPQSLARRLGRALVYLLRLAGFALLALLVIGMGLMFFMDYRAVSQEIAPAPSQVSVPEDLPYAVEEVHFAGGDGLELAGWYVPPQNGAAVILLHGYSGNRLHVTGYAKMLVKAGFGVLMYDQRASGESQGNFRAHGWIDAPDVGGAIAYLKSLPEVDAQRLGIAGCSIGGQIALQGAAAYPELKAVWADGASAILARDNPPPENWANALAYLSNLLIDWIYTWRLDMPRPPAMINIIGKIAPRPIMLVGGGNPRPYFGSEAPRAQRYAAYAGPNAQLWIIAEATHCDGPQQQPDEYEKRLVDFFNQALVK